MKIWAIGDLHLSFGVPNKKMDIFGPQWTDHANKIEAAWEKQISENDLVLLPGDFSWAKLPEEAKLDFEWIHQRPGTKVLIKGNHDYWWGSLKKLKSIIPPSCHLIQNNHFDWQDVSIGGTRLWDVPGLNFSTIINYQKSADLTSTANIKEEIFDSLAIYSRELARLELSLQKMSQTAKTRIVMTHYPPIGLDFKDTEVSRLLEKYHVNHCVFGHLHNIKASEPLFGVHNEIHYHLTSCDYLHFKPIKIID